MSDPSCGSGIWDIIASSADQYLEKGLRHLPSEEQGATGSLNPSRVVPNTSSTLLANSVFHTSPNPNTLQMLPRSFIRCCDPTFSERPPKNTTLHRGYTVQPSLTLKMAAGSDSTAANRCMSSCQLSWQLALSFYFLFTRTKF